jgi:hypothetical protein
MSLVRIDQELFLRNHRKDLSMAISPFAGIFAEKFLTLGW